jgi:cytochrome c oxidase cbb3-type subunit 3
MSDLRDKMKSERRPDTPRNHVFDGIEEYDNDLPRWWVGLFVATVVFAAGYFLYFETPSFKAPTLVDEYEATAAAAKAIAAAGAGAPGAFDYAASVGDQAQVAAGRETFEQICASCHGAKGEGLVGPNLTDAFWLHGHKLADLEATVTNGVMEKGMPSWREVLGVPKIRQIISYIKTIQGTSPLNPKAPQGEPGELE